MSNQPGTEKKQGMSGCAIAAIVVGGLVVLGMVAVGAGVALFMRSGAGHALGETMASAANAATAPGTAEMRAIGCENPTSMDLSAMGHFAKGLVADAGPADAKAADDLLGTFAINCTSPTLTCEQVAAAWGKGATPAARTAMVSVTTTTGTPVCAGNFSRAGVRLP